MVMGCCYMMIPLLLFFVVFMGLLCFVMMCFRLSTVGKDVSNNVSICHDWYD
jgi:hypothetical protein